METQFSTSELKFFTSLFYHRIDIRFTPVEDITLKYWPGSIIRNNLLYMARDIEVENDISLFNAINTIPIEELHPYYKELSGGFPKGYSLLNVQFGGSTEQSISLHKDGIYSFSVCLIGAMSRYYASFIEAIKKMCARGIGTPMVSLNLIDVSETHPFHASRLLWFNGTETINELKLPIRFDDFVQQPALKNKIRIQLITPLNLVQSREKKNKEISFQDKQNGFPGFYQFMRSVIYRLVKLNALYCEKDYDLFKAENMSDLEKWIQSAANPILDSVNIRKISVVSTPKKENDSIMKFHGYVGEMSYYGDFSEFIPLLLFARGLNVGNDVTYGLGEYRIK